MDDIKLVSFLSIKKDLASVMHVLGLICLGIYTLSPMRNQIGWMGGAPMGAEVDSFTY